MSFQDLAKATNKNLSNARDYLDEKVDSILSPKSTEGISGWVFDVPATESLKLSADITDHYTENNSFINDHRVIKPREVSLTGFIGELVFRPPRGIQGAFQQLQNLLTVVEAYGPDFTPQITQINRGIITTTESGISKINQALDRFQNVVAFFEGIGQEDTKQQKAYQELKALFFSNQLLTVSTPWDFFDNMVMKDITFVQNDDSESYSDISINLKEMRFTDVRTVNYDDNLFPVREEMQSSETLDNGTIKGEDKTFFFELGEAGGLIQ